MDTICTTPARFEETQYTTALIKTSHRPLPTWTAWACPWSSGSQPCLGTDEAEFEGQPSLCEPVRFLHEPHPDPRRGLWRNDYDYRISSKLRNTANLRIRQNVGRLRNLKNSLGFSGCESHRCSEMVSVLCGDRFSWCTGRVTRFRI